MIGKLFNNNPTVKITINGNPALENYKKIYSKFDYPSFLKNDVVQGHLDVKISPGKPDSHRGITLTIYGQFTTKNGDLLSRFFERTQTIAPPGELSADINTDFSFDKLDFPVSSFFGVHTNVEYGVELKIIHRLIDFKETSPFLVFLFSHENEAVPIHNEIGMTNILHIEFIFPKSDFDCHECVIGRAYFILVKLKVVHMNVSLYCAETYDNGGKFIKEKTVIDTIELMDGAPVRGDHIPIRYFLGSNDIWPFHSWSGSPLKVDYYLRAQMIDENGKKYYKRLKVNIIRRKPENIQAEEETKSDADDYMK